MSDILQLGAFTAELASENDKPAVVVRNVAKTWSMSFTFEHQAFALLSTAIGAAEKDEIIWNYLEMWLTMVWATAQLFPDNKMIEDFFAMADARIDREEKEPDRDISQEEYSELIALEQMRKLTETEEKVEQLAKEVEQEVKQAKENGTEK